MRYEILFIQGAGNVTTAEEQFIVNALSDNLGSDFTVIYPHMPDADHPAYAAWDNVLAQSLQNLSGKVILFGHSLGASIILKHFAMTPVPEQIIGMVLFGVPYWKDQDWDVSEYVIADAFLANLRKLRPIYFYYALDDEVIPYAHLEAYKQLLPQANWRIISGADHTYHAAITGMINDVQELVSRFR